jgi:hypothetical protein
MLSLVSAETGTWQTWTIFSVLEELMLGKGIFGLAKCGFVSAGAHVPREQLTVHVGCLAHKQELIEWRSPQEMK